MFRICIIFVCLLAFCLPAAAQCPCGPTCKCDPCVCHLDNDDVPTVGPHARAALAWAAAMTQTVSVKSDYANAYVAALAENKILVVGVGCDTPPGDWLSVRVEEPITGAYGTVFGPGTTVVLRKGASGSLEVAKAFQGQPGTVQVATAISAPVQTQVSYGQPVYGSVCGPNGCNPQMGMPMMGGFGMLRGGFGGGCAGGNCGG